MILPARLLQRRFVLAFLFGCCSAYGTCASPSAAQGASPDRTAESQESAEGQRPTVYRIHVEGADRYLPSQIIAAFGQVEGEPLISQEEISRGIEVCFDTFRVRVSVEIVAAEGGGVEIHLRIKELSLDLEPRFIGNVEISTEKLLEWAQLRDDEELYLYQAPRIRQRLLRSYLDEGYYYCEINVVEREGGVDKDSGEYNAPDVIFEIKEGPEVKVRDVVIQGNDALKNQGLWWFKGGLSPLAKVKLKKPWFFGLFAKDFVREKLDADLVAMRQVYRDLGYLNAIVELDRLKFSTNRRKVTIYISVDEGERYTVGSLDFVGIERVVDPRTPSGFREANRDLVISAEELRAFVALQTGEIYEERVIDRDRAALRRRYGELGYIGHPTLPVDERWEFFDPLLVFESDRPVVHVTYRISQGRQQRIREILITGNKHTQDRVIRSRISVRPGEVADPVEIERSRGRITATGFFSDDTSPGHIPPRYRFLETDEAGVKDVEYIVEEGQVLNFQLAGGISSGIGAFGTVQLSMSNFDITNLPSSPWAMIGEIAKREAFHGAGQSLAIRASPGVELSQFDVRFVEPDLFRLHTERIGIALNTRLVRQLFGAYRELRVANGFELSRQLSPDSSAFGGYSFGSVDVDEIDFSGEPVIGDDFLTVPQSLVDQQGKNDLSGIQFGYRYRRVDHAFVPRNGIAFSASNFLYAGELGSDFNYYKLNLRFDWYDEFDENPDLVSDRYHFGLQLGTAIPFGDTAVVPYTERFFLGGPRRMRGFDFRGVGPQEGLNGYPAGGSNMLYGTLEYRRPLVKQIQPGTYREVESLQGGLFIDVGVLDPQKLSLDFDQTRISVGFLFGLPIPIPITFSFGWPLRDGPGDDTQVLGFDIGF
ncbi:MAG: hypothetical protein CMJ89_07055 [Planctomycetes bacterium]|nr:hypothetical protein [Planctomycetota bacterium]